MVFVSAGVNKGAEWLHTPDYRKGDRNGQQLLPKYPLRIGSTYIIKEQGFTAPEDFDPYPRANVHRQRPGNGPRGDAIFDAFTAANFPISSSNANAGPALISRYVEYFKHMGLTNHQRIKHADVGIKDNAHFMFLEKNNQGIAAATKNSLGYLPT
ncbi:hypothetical protein PMIN04_007527 [Paraphaeosphaeria minitans]